MVKNFILKYIFIFKPKRKLPNILTTKIKKLVVDSILVILQKIIKFENKHCKVMIEVYLFET